MSDSPTIPRNLVESLLDPVNWRDEVATLTEEQRKGFLLALQHLARDLGLEMGGSSPQFGAIKRAHNAALDAAARFLRARGHTYEAVMICEMKDVS